MKFAVLTPNSQGSFDSILKIETEQCKSLELEQILALMRLAESFCFASKMEEACIINLNSRKTLFDRRTKEDRARESSYYRKEIQL